MRVVLVALLLLLAGAGPATASTPRTRTPIEHLVYLMQGDRTFDHYFGTYPGVDGLTQGDRQEVDPAHPAAGAVAPYPLHGSGPVSPGAGPRLVQRQFDGGRMDSFVFAFERQGRDGRVAMGYYDRRDLPFYWNAADRYELFDHFFASSLDGTRTNRAHWVAGTSDLKGPTIFDRLQQAGVSWKFYVQNYDPKQTYRSSDALTTQTVRVPLLDIPRFADGPKLNSHIADLGEYYRDLERGTLPAVAYIASSGAGERSARSVPAGQRLARELTSQLMVSHYWSSCALLWSYDGSGGWYDHVKPPSGRGLRVPAVLVSPYAPQGGVQHGQFEAASALRFVVENWGLRPLGGRTTGAHSLADAFDFGAPPRQAELIPADARAAALPVARRPSPAPVYTVYGVASAVVAGLMWGAVWPKWRTS
ncbi:MULTISPECIES: alkaline phosphatase family protein [Streptomyces]|uniref:alkaline phosphatase family protein n=1 Tax=Streptomyces TaxID=1883 RepID=UPI002931199B|nr:alkaline phosphatase family protein [Streptomyces sp. NEAU-HV9]